MRNSCRIISERTPCTPLVRLSRLASAAPEHLSLIALTARRAEVGVQWRAHCEPKRRGRHEVPSRRGMECKKTWGGCPKSHARTVRKCSATKACTSMPNIIAKKKKQVATEAHLFKEAMLAMQEASSPEAREHSHVDCARRATPISQKHTSTQLIFRDRCAQRCSCRCLAAQTCGARSMR